MPRPSAIARTVVIPDVHQDIAWVRRILAINEGAERVVFLGDYFDTGVPGRASVGDTCAFLLDVQSTLGPRVTFLLGNHDIQYLEAKPFCDQHRTPRSLKYDCGPSFSGSTAKKVAKALSPDFWDAAGLFVLVDDWLLSHAGVAACYWPPLETPEAALAELEQRCARALRELRGPVPHLLLGAGFCRGGDQARGGITWLDWDEEFNDRGTPFPQIVGHTSSAAGARQQGRSWCLDGRQTTYGVLEQGALRVARA